MTLLTALSNNQKLILSAQFKLRLPIYYYSVSYVPNTIPNIKNKNQVQYITMS